MSSLCPAPESPVASGTDPGHQTAAVARARIAAGAKKNLVVVLGMHRSGTSLLANLLTVLGVDLGQNLLSADCNNEAGYWEQKQIYRIHDDLLETLGRRWIGPAGTVPFPPQWWKQPEIKPFRDRLETIVESEISRTGNIWGFKDPRTSRLLPLWKGIFSKLDLEPLYLLALRQPSAVVQSIVRRDKISAARAELLWLLHNLDAVRDAGERLRLVVDYDRWFTHPREQAQAVVCALGLDWPENEETVLRNVTNRIRADLRHCNAGPEEFSLPFVAETYAELKQAAITGRFSAEFQRIERNVRRAISLCEPWACVVAELTRPRTAPEFSFVEHFSTGTFECLGASAQAAIWDAQIDGEMCRAIFLHPPARLHFNVPDGRRARLTFAVNIHPHAWDKPRAGGCEFIVTVNGAIFSSVKLDPVNLPSDRRWHECVLDIPESANGAHNVVFETRALGDSLDFRWAVWRDPLLDWEASVPTACATPAASSTQQSKPIKPMKSQIVSSYQNDVAGTFSSQALSESEISEIKAMARDHLHANRDKEARALCRQLLNQNPSDREALDLLAKCHFDLASLLRSAENVTKQIPAAPARRATLATAPNSTQSQIQRLADHVGRDWKQQPYYDEAEAHMDKQWQETVWPFIQKADFSCVLDLAAGHGRNGEKLKRFAEKIYIVDINQENIDYCRQRFNGDPRFVFIRNDGCSLQPIPSNSLTLVYCFDAMVHFDSDVVREYLREFKRTLRPGGLGFCHHSNYAANPSGDVHDNPGWRNFMSDSLFAHYCVKEGLVVLRQRIINWSAPGSDCVTLFKKP
jgi:ubiquinone/menaquinone biosynthesis C-methylase UbiE